MTASPAKVSQQDAAAATSGPRFIYSLFFVSGAAGLIYQVVWSRLLSEIFGVTIYAVTTVLATFLGGLALGGFLLGRAADKTHRPLRMFGLLELGIGLTALAGLWLLHWLEPVHIWAANHLLPNSPVLIAVRAALAALIVLPPTILMGGTLPAFTRACVSRFERMGRELSLLYALNTAGAVTGCLLSGFVLIRAYGLRATLLVAVALNVLVGLSAVLIAGRRGVVQSQSESSFEKARTPMPLSRVGLPLVMALSGFSSLGFEVIWTRILVLVVDSSAYAFVTMLASFLVGITLGSFLAAPLMDRARDLRRLFGWIQIGIAASALATLPIMSRFDPGRTLNWLEQMTLNWATLIAARFGLSFMIMLVPTILIGMTFPIAARIWARDLQSLGTHLGQIYSANTFGNILGAAATGFVLLPLLGLQKSLAVLAAINVACAAWGLLPGGRPLNVARGARLLMTAAGAITAASLALLWTPPPFQMADERPGDVVLHYQEDVVATVKVIQRREDASRVLMGVDAIKIAESGGGVDEKQQVLAHFPFLLTPRSPPRNVLSIGLGSAILIGEVAQHPELETLECVELSPGVIRGASCFSTFNHGVLSDPRVHVINDDGVNYLRRTNRQFDAMISDAKSRTGHSGNAVFFSEDYYRLCRDRLTPAGLMIQWVPMFEPPGDVRIITRTFLQVFPHVYVWATPPYSFFMVGARQPLTLSLGYVQDQLQTPPYARLRNYGWTDAGSLLAMLMADRNSLDAALAAETSVNTLDHPVLEFYSFSHHATRPGERGRENMELLRSARRSADKLIQLEGADATSTQRAHKASGVLLEALLDLVGKSGPAEEAGFHKMEQALAIAPECGAVRYAVADAYRTRARSADESTMEARLRRALELWPAEDGQYLSLGTLQLRHGRLDEAALLLAEAVRLNPDLRDAQKRLGSALLQQGTPVDAESHLREALRIDPSDAEAHYLLGRSLAAQRKLDEAVEAYGVALRLEPRNAATHLSLGVALANAGAFESAAASFRQSLEIEPNTPQAHAALADALYKLGQHAEAAKNYRAALALRAEWPQVENSLAWLLATCPLSEVRDGSEAVHLAESLCRRGQFANPRHLDTLAAAYAETGDFEQAQQFARQAVERARSAGQDTLAGEIEARLDLYRQGKPHRAKQ